ncbi:MAG: hypothetical protein ABI972_29430 [Acidobacteriota bacterium]
MPSNLQTEIYAPPEFLENFSALPRDVKVRLVAALPVLDEYMWDRTPPLVEDPVNSGHFTYALGSDWVMRMFAVTERTSRGVPFKRRITLLGCFPV